MTFQGDFNLFMGRHELFVKTTDAELKFISTCSRSANKTEGGGGFSVRGQLAS